jgi:toxin ParE1/3/4
VNVRWTDTAIDHLQAIHDYIARHSDTYALRMVDRITRRTEQIATAPHSGPMVPEYESPEIREIFEKPYRIIDRVRPDQIDVLAVIHGARQLPAIDGIDDA